MHLRPHWTKKRAENARLTLEEANIENNTVLIIYFTILISRSSRFTPWNPELLFSFKN
jgi:hypothetical protein